MIAKVVFPIPLDKEFDYLVPDAWRGALAPGRFVLVPFGRRRACGFVRSLAKTSAVRGLKAIQDPLTAVPALGKGLLELAGFISRYYLCSFGEAVFSMAPSWLSRQPVYTLRLGRGATAKLEGMPQGSERRLLEKLLKKGSLELKSLSVAARSLRRRRLIKVEERSEGVGREVAETGTRELSFGRGPELSGEQERAVKAILDEETGVCLLHGVTAAGKTEVYLHAMESVLKAGRDVIFLVPEISLTPQIGGWVEERFGAAVIPYHSGLAQKERRRNWLLAARGQGRVVVGARSAIFAPLPRLGLIVVDEEPEGAYKQEDAPRYNARDLAVVRGKLEKARVILGSATPSIESYHNCLQGNYRLLEMPSRIEDKSPPRLELVDLRQQIGKGGAVTLSHRLRQAIGERLEKKEKVLLFLNRRGYSTSVICGACGEVLRCRNCALALVYHREDEKLRCHYCDYRSEPMGICPACREERLIRLGAGTERVSEELRGMFPGAKVERLDIDVGRRKGAYEQTFAALRRGEIDILVGTQIIAKGLDFPAVTLVGVVLADVALNLPDFRSSERTYQLITQVGGRAGRGEKQGLVIVQTYNPGHFGVRAACTGSYRDYYEQEVEFRREHHYPPFCRLVNVLFLARREAEAKQAAARAKARIVKGAEREKVEIECLGPSPAFRSYLRGQHRYQLVVKCPRQSNWHGVIRRAMPPHSAKGRVDIKVDVDPQSLL